jgi:hypothetical protein
MQQTAALEGDDWIHWLCGAGVSADGERTVEE